MKEVWKDIKGYEGLYQVSNYGTIKRLAGNRKIRPYEYIVKPHISGQRTFYNKIALMNNSKAKIYFIHRLVLINFNRLPKSGEECNHIDRNPFNNKINNLEWVTHMQNIIHSRENYRNALVGEKHPASKVTDHQAIEIKKLRKTGFRYTDIAKTYNITYHTCYSIINRSYSHINYLV